MIDTYLDTVERLTDELAAANADNAKLARQVQRLTARLTRISARNVALQKAYYEATREGASESIRVDNMIAVSTRNGKEGE